MAVDCEFINLIIPINKINAVYPGGFKKFKDDHPREFLGRFCHDDALFRDGAMNYRDLNHIVKKWEAKGLHGVTEINGKQQWLDFCVIDCALLSREIPCNWLEYDAKNKSASIIVQREV